MLVNQREKSSIVWSKILAENRLRFLRHRNMRPAFTIAQTPSRFSALASKTVKTFVLVEHELIIRNFGFDTKEFFDSAKLKMGGTVDHELLDLMDL